LKKSGAWLSRRANTRLVSGFGYLRSSKVA
jgi:hypothetical protein